MTKRSYEEEAIRLSKVIDIAIESFEKFELENKDWFTKVYLEYKESILSPEPQFRNMTSLKYSISDIFTMFQECTGEEIEYFWKQIEKQNLGYIREDKLAKIMKRGKINSRIEFEYATDVIVVAEQEKRITKDEVKKLAKMIGKFELRKRN